MKHSSNGLISSSSSISSLMFFTYRLVSSLLWLSSSYDSSILITPFDIRAIKLYICNPYNFYIIYKYKKIIILYTHQKIYIVLQALNCITRGGTDGYEETDWLQQGLLRRLDAEILCAEEPAQERGFDGCERKRLRACD